MYRLITARSARAFWRSRQRSSGLADRSQRLCAAADRIRDGPAFSRRIGALFAFFGRYASASYMFYQVSVRPCLDIVGGAGTMFGRWSAPRCLS